MRSSRSCAICTGYTFDRPLRASRGFSAVEPVARDVERVQPPGVAHRRAQRQRLAAGAGAEVDHHLAALGVGQQRQQLAAFVLHLDLAAREDVELVQRRLAREAQSPGRIRRRHGLDAGLRAAPACTSSRLAFSVLTRRSSGAGCVERLRRAARTRRRAAACSGSASQSGRLWRSLSGRAAAVDLRTCGQPGLFVRHSAARRKAASPCQARIASRRSIAPAAASAPGAGTAGAGAARRRSSRPACGARARRARGAGGRRPTRRCRPAASKLQHRAQQFGRELEQGVGRASAASEQSTCAAPLGHGIDAAIALDAAAGPSTNQRTASG